MKCPLFVINDIRARSGEETETGDCLGEECKWNDDRIDQCSILSIPLQLQLLQNSLQELIKKIPHELQFRK